MTFDLARISMLLDVVIKAAQIGTPDTANIIASVHDDLKKLNVTLGEERAKAKAEADARAAEEKAKADAAANAAPIESVPRDASGNIVSPPKAVPSTPEPTMAQKLGFNSGA